MGYIATIVVNVDALHLIKDDKDFGKNVYYAVQSVDNEQRSIVVGGFCSAATAIEKHHSNYAIPILVGGYQDRIVKDVVVNYTSGENTELEVLKQLAAKHGFSLRKKKVG